MHFIYPFLSSFVLGTDLFAKHYIEKTKNDAFPRPLFWKIRLEKHHNYGFMLNKCSGRPDTVRRTSLLSMISVGLWTIYVFTPGRKSSRLLKTGTSLLAGGALSNTFDRVKRSYVVDYLRFPKIRLIFNIGDLGIFAGAALNSIGTLFIK